MKREIYFTQIRGQGGETHILLKGETTDGQVEEVFYRRGSIISKKIAVWRLKLLLRCY
jgi:catabolite regulation protein CreA